MGMAPPLPGDGDRWALFLDVDGTLVEIATTPHAVRVAPSLLPLLERLRSLCDGALALVSGRRLADLDALFAPLHLPAAGLHGAERRRADGGLAPVPLDAGLLDGVRPALLGFTAARPGLFLEDKGGSLAIHYRKAPQYGAALRRLARGLAAAEPRLRLIEGRKVVELQPRGCDKGLAIAAFQDEPPFRGRRPVFAGDDTTDEDGFLAVNRLGGVSIKVRQNETRVRPPSAARFRVDSGAALRDWLTAVAARLEAGVNTGHGETPACHRALS